MFSPSVRSAHNLGGGGASSAHKIAESHEASLREEEPAFESDYSQQHSARSKNKVQKQPPLIEPDPQLANDLSDDEYSSLHSRTQDLSPAQSSPPSSSQAPTRQLFQHSGEDRNPSQFDVRHETLGSVTGVPPQQSCGLARDDSLLLLPHTQTAAFPEGVAGPEKVEQQSPAKPLKQDLSIVTMEICDLAG